MSTREQKLLFCFMKAIARGNCSFDAVSTAKKLTKCGVPCDVSRTADQKAQCLALLKFLHIKFSNTMPEKKRRNKYAIFTVILRASYDNFLEQCSLSEDPTDEEVDRVYACAKSTDSCQCQMLLKNMLAHVKRDKAALANLIVASGATRLQKSTSCLKSLQRLPQTEESPSICWQSGSTRSVIQGLTKIECGILLRNTLKLNEQNVVNLARLLECCTDRTRKVSPYIAVVLKTSGDSFSTDLARLQEKDFDVQCDALLSRILSSFRKSQEKLRKSRLAKLCAPFFRVAGPGRVRAPKLANKEVGVSSEESKADSSGADSSEDDLHEFAFQEVGHNWKHLGAVLGFEFQELEAIEQRRNRKDAQAEKESAWEVVEKFRDHKGAKVATKEKLRNKLRKAKARLNYNIPREEKTLSDLLPKFLIADKRFHGRERDLRIIENFFWNRQASTSHVQPIQSQRLLIVSGVGGVGKTSLVSRYVHKHALAYQDGVFYFNAETSASFFASLKQNERFCKDRLSSTTGSFQAMDDFLDYLKKHPRSLVIMDNADEYELIKDQMPNPVVACHILLSSRSSNLDAFLHHKNMHHIMLDTLEKGDAIAALLAWSGKPPESFEAMPFNEKKYAEKLATESPVEALPLALAHAGTFINRHNKSFQAYWKLIDSEAKKFDADALDLDKFLRYFHLSHLKEFLLDKRLHRIQRFANLKVEEMGLGGDDQEALSRAVNAFKTKRRVFLTWELDIDDVKEDSSDGYLILLCSSVMSSRDIPLDVIGDVAFPSVTEDRDLKLDDGIRELNEHSLVQNVTEPDNELLVTFCMHNLIQASALQRLRETPGEYRRILRAVSKALYDRLPHWNRFNELLNSSDLQSLFPHVYAVAEKFLEANMINETYPGLVDYSCQLARCFRHWESARRLCSLRVKVFENLSASSFDIEERNARRQKYYYDYASVCFSLRQLDYVDCNIRMALGERHAEELDDSELLSFINELSLLADSYELQGLLDDSERILLRLIASFSEMEASEASFCTFQACLRLSRVYYSAERFDEQVGILQEAYILGTSGKFDPGLSLADCCRSLAGALKMHGYFREALPKFFEALEIFRKMLPENDERIGILLFEMAVCLIQHKELARGCDYSREGLLMVRSLLPSDHPRVADALFWHGRNLNLAERSEEAIKVLEECLSCSAAMPESVEILSIKAQCLAALGDALLGQKLMVNCTNERKREIIRRYKESIDLFDALFPDGKFEFAYALLKLGTAYMQIGNFSEALTMLKRAWIFSKKIPVENWARMGFVSGYAMCLCLKGKLTEAESVLVEARRDCKGLPSDHRAIPLLRNGFMILQAMGGRNREQEFPDISQLADADLD